MELPYIKCDTAFLFYKLNYWHASFCNHLIGIELLAKYTLLYHYSFQKNKIPASFLQFPFEIMPWKEHTNQSVDFLYLTLESPTT